MSLLNKLTIKSLKLNKKRTIVTIIGIVLSVALITAVATMYSSAISSLIKFETYQKGNFHYAYYNVSLSDLNIFENNRKIENVYYVKHIGYATLENSQNKEKPYAHIMAFDKDSLENLSIKLVSGRLPKNDNEILISTHLKTNARITLNIGDTITLDVGKRVSNGYELNQNNPLNETEEVIEKQAKKYKIVGIIERPATSIEPYSAPGYTFITYMNDKTGNLDVYTRYTKEGLKEHYRVTANILGINPSLFEKINSGNFTPSEKELKDYTEEFKNVKYEINVNSYLIKLETNPLDLADTGGQLGIVVLIVCAIIVFTSVFCIKNSFDISITEKIKQYGMLRSVGATKKQIKKNVFYEATILGLIGIPLGILFGILASYILIIVSNIFMKDMFTEGINLIFSLSWIAMIFSVILGIITIYLSALKSARRASKVSPIDSIRNSENIKIKSKKLKSLRIINNLFGIGGDISYKNLKRNKKKYRTTVISIIVSVSIFIALYSFVNLSFISVQNELKVQEYNLSLFSYAQKDKTFYDKLLDTTKFNNVKEYSILRNELIEIKDVKYSKQYVDALNIRNISSKNVGIYAVGEDAYKKYIEELGLRYEDVKDKAILMDKTNFSVYNEENKKRTYYNIRTFDYKKGDKIRVSLDSKKQQTLDLEIGFITDKLPFSLKFFDNEIIIVSDEFYNKEIRFIEDESGLSVYYKSDDPDKLQDEIEEYMKDYNVNINNSAENVRIMENLFTLIAIFLYGFIIVISLIGITNIFNTITTNMELRKQEFAMLKSIGMTSKEFNKMIRLESAFMGFKSLLFGIPIGIFLSYLIYNFLAKESVTSYPFPYVAILICIVVVFLLITSLMKYSMNKINKQNTIETIRNENI